MFSKQFFALTTLLLPALAVPSPLLTVSKVANATPGRYIITLKEGVSRASHLGSVQSKIASTPSTITHEFSIINGYAGEFSPDDLNELRTHPDIALIEEDGISHTFVTKTQNDAPWGLARISSQEKLSGSSDAALNFEYKYDSSAGSGATVYIIDTGIFVDHPAFDGRASWGTTFGGYPDQDGNGHGTHCAGTAVSGPFGVAKSANVIAVKVLDDGGSGQNSDIISGIDWVASEAKNSGKPTVASMSLGGGASDSIDSAVRALYAAGVTIVVAAGNDGQDASNTSPARVEEAITIGASTFDDTMADFSNFGSPVDVFAPGVDITSAWNDGNTNTISGTSMATPHVAGYAAYLLGLDSSLSPADVASSIDSGALSGALSQIPSGTVNKLLNNGL